MGIAFTHPNEVFVTGIAVKCESVLGQVHHRTIFGAVKRTFFNKTIKSSKSMADNVCSKIRLRETAAW